MRYRQLFTEIESRHCCEYISLQTAEGLLNDAVIRANIAAGYEEFLEIFEVFYSDDAEFSSDTSESIYGKAEIRRLLLNFLVPLHVVAEVGGVSVTLSHRSFATDAAGEMHSAWTLDLVAPSGKSCRLTWCTRRVWHGMKVVYERHYSHLQSGGPLTLDDFSFNSDWLRS